MSQENKAPDPTPFLTINNPHTKFNQVFQTVEELLTFLTREQSFFNGLPKPKHQNNAQRWNDFIAPVAQLRAEVHQFTTVTAKNPKTIAQICQKVKAQYENSSQFFTSTSRQAQLLVWIRDRCGPECAGSAVSYFCGSKDGDVANNGGFAIAALFDQSNKNESDRATFKDLLGDCQTTFQKMNEDRVAVDKVFKKLIEDRNKELDTLREAYKAVQATQEPAGYWNEKHEDHLAYAWRFASVAIATSIIGAVLLIGGSLWVQSTITDQSLWGVAPKAFPLAIGFLFIFWAVRALMRLCFSHYHLATDASERALIIRTFRAISVSGWELDKPERALFLGQIFRHATTDINKDDAAPTMPITELLKKSPFT